MHNSRPQWLSRNTSPSSTCAARSAARPSTSARTSSARLAIAAETALTGGSEDGRRRSSSHARSRGWRDSAGQSGDLAVIRYKTHTTARSIRARHVYRRKHRRTCPRQSQLVVQVRRGESKGWGERTKRHCPTSGRPDRRCFSRCASSRPRMLRPQATRSTDVLGGFPASRISASHHARRAVVERSSAPLTEQAVPP